MAIRRCVNASTRKSPNSPVARVSIFAVFLLFRPLLGKLPQGIIRIMIDDGSTRSLGTPSRCVARWRPPCDSLLVGTAS